MNALIVYGGWDGHKPRELAEIIKTLLAENSIQATLSDTLSVLEDSKNLQDLDLIIPHWTMGSLSADQWNNLDQAVQAGTGIAGIHGGMGDAFRENTNYQFMVGGQWVAHPGNILRYRVYIMDHVDEVTAGLEHFEVESEQYYMHVDPSNHVLATTTFEYNGCTMPVAWKRMWGKGRVFYCSLGHKPDDLDIPQARTLIKRGLQWAAQSETLASA